MSVPKNGRSRPKEAYIVRVLALALALTLVFPMVALAATAELTIYALDSAGLSSATSGHSWISVKNTSAGSIYLNGVTIPPGYTQHVGTWGNLFNDTAWYNMEPYSVATLGKSVTGRVSLTQGISSTELATVGTWIRSHSTWSRVQNCSWFATGVWNSVADTKVYAGIPSTPLATVLCIKSKAGDVTNRSLGTWSSGTVGYFSGTTFVRTTGTRTSLYSSIPME